MTDTIWNEPLGVEITPYVKDVSRTPSLAQVVNTSLSGLAYIQNVGKVTYQLTVDIVLSSAQDSVLMTAWVDGDLVKVINDDTVYYGYIIGVSTGDDYADGFHEATILLQEEIT